MTLNATVASVTDRIVARSAPLRTAYLDRCARARETGPKRALHGFAEDVLGREPGVLNVRGTIQE